MALVITIITIVLGFLIFRLGVARIESIQKKKETEALWEQYQGYRQRKAEKQEQTCAEPPRPLNVPSFSIKGDHSLPVIQPVPVRKKEASPNQTPQPQRISSPQTLPQTKLESARPRYIKPITAPQENKISQTTKTECRYFPRAVFTPTEHRFFLTLVSVCKNKFYIIPKMGLWALVDHRDDITSWNKISKKHLDFTLCEPETMEPMLVIELDDPSHRKAKAKKRDAEKDEILAEVGVPILRIFVANKYNEEELKEKIRRTAKNCF